MRALASWGGHIAEDRSTIRTGALVAVVSEIDRTGTVAAEINQRGAPHAGWAEDFRSPVVGPLSRQLQPEPLLTTLSTTPLCSAAPRPARDSQPVHLLAVPYYAWANRGPGTMRVWIPRC